MVCVGEIGIGITMVIELVNDKLASQTYDTW